MNCFDPRKFPILFATLFVSSFALAQVPTTPQQATPGQPQAVAEASNEEIPRFRIFYSSLGAARMNAIGLAFDTRLTLRWRLYEDSRLAFKNNFFGIGLAPFVNPSFVSVGPLVEFQPASFAQVWAMYQAVHYFGSFNLFQSFPTPSSDYSPDVIQARGQSDAPAALQSYSTDGTQLTLGLLLQGKVGPWAMRNLARFTRGDYNLRDGDRVYYDSTYDIAAPDGGWLYNNDLDFLYQENPRQGWVYGVRWSTTHAYYRASDWGGVRETNPNTISRVGPIFAYTFFTQNGARYNTPTLIGIVNWYLNHRYRDGTAVSRAVPYVVLGFAFSGDLLSGQK